MNILRRHNGVALMLQEFQISNNENFTPLSALSVSGYEHCLKETPVPLYHFNQSVYISTIPDLNAEDEIELRT